MAGDSRTAVVMVVLIALVLVLGIFTRFFPQPINAAGSAFGTASLTIEGLCIFDLAANWNFISLCAEPLNKTVDSVTQSISGDYDYILKWNETSQAYDLYSIYATSKPFNELEQNSSYFLHMTDSHTGFSVSGNTTGSMNISLVNKWNSPSWPYEFARDVSRYMGTINGSWEYLLKWDATAQSYSLYSIYAATKPFTQIFKGEGQFMYINASSAVLVYNRTALS